MNLPLLEPLEQAANLDVDGGRGTKIEDLADNICRREREGRIRELPGQGFTQCADIFSRRRMMRLQCNLDIAIL